MLGSSLDCELLRFRFYRNATEWLELSQIEFLRSDFCIPCPDTMEMHIILEIFYGKQEIGLLKKFKNWTILRIEIFLKLIFYEQNYCLLSHDRSQQVNSLDRESNWIGICPSLSCCAHLACRLQFSCWIEFVTFSQVWLMENHKDDFEKFHVNVIAKFLNM
jgi:hypothetical protein